MIKLLIVDDEDNTRDGLKKYVPWKKLGVDIVETAKNGLDALKMADRLGPDILLTDIKMPVMDGMELASRIREAFPECSIIFLSAYADKEYLKQAISLKAVSFIEKPVVTNELKSVISNTVIQYRGNTAKKAGEACQEAALELVGARADTHVLTEKYKDVLPGFPFDSAFITAYIRVNWRVRPDDRTRDSIKPAIIEFFSGPDSFCHHSSLVGFDADDNIILIVPVNEKIREVYSNSAFERLLGRLGGVAGSRIDFSIGVGRLVSGIGQLSASFREAAAASDLQFYEGFGKVFNYSRINGARFKVENSLYDLFTNFLVSGKKNEAAELVKKLTHDAGLFETADIDGIKNIYFNFLLIIFKTAMDKGFIDLYGESEKKYIWQEIDKINLLSGLSEYILSNMEEIFSRMEEKDAINRKTYEIVKYIKENYSSKERSVRSIAEHTYLSPTYLCAFFKKNAGKTLNEYITEIRMEKAKELLKDSRLRLYDIAKSVGLSGANYFSTVFKRYTGYIPSEFREKHYL